MRDSKMFKLSVTCVVSCERIECIYVSSPTCRLNSMYIMCVEQVRGFELLNCQLLVG